MPGCEIQRGRFRLSSNSLHQLKNSNGHKRVIKSAGSRFMTCIPSMQFICICRKAIILIKANLSANFWENIWLGAARELFKVVLFSTPALRLCKLKCGFRFDNVRLKTSCLPHPLMSFFDHQDILFWYKPSTVDWPRHVRSDFLLLGQPRR